MTQQFQISKSLPTGGQANAKGMSKLKVQKFWYLKFGFHLAFELCHLNFHGGAVGYAL
jgi:hypothetical protein